MGNILLCKHLILYFGFCYLIARIILLLISGKRKLAFTDVWACIFNITVIIYFHLYYFIKVEEDQK